jgi:hypothetical protein
MRKVLLLIHCDGCRRLYEFSHAASEDTAAWHVHSDTLIKMALADGWHQTCCRNYHYCCVCLKNNPLLQYS